MPRLNYFEEIQLGQKFEGTFITVTDYQILQFALITGDVHPLFLSDSFAAQNSAFKKRVAHAALVTSIAIGSALPPITGLKMECTGAHLGENWKYRAPVFIGDAICTDTVVTALEPKKNFGVVHFEITVKNQREEVVAIGESILGFPYKTE